MRECRVEASQPRISDYNNTVVDNNNNRNKNNNERRRIREEGREGKKNVNRINRDHKNCD